MRSIKFRGKISGKWHYVTPDNHYLWSKFWAIVDRDTVEEFTGRTDRKAQEIYEHNIVRVNGGEGDWEFISEVIFANAAFRIAEVFDQGWPHQEDIEVIGDRYDDPELLGEQRIFTSNRTPKDESGGLIFNRGDIKQ